jgi:hypothetical protein
MHAHLHAHTSCVRELVRHVLDANIASIVAPWKMPFLIFWSQGTTSQPELSFVMFKNLF